MDAVDVEDDGDDDEVPELIKSSICDCENPSVIIFCRTAPSGSICLIFIYFANGLGCSSLSGVDEDVGFEVLVELTGGPGGLRGGFGG